MLNDAKDGRRSPVFGAAANLERVTLGRVTQRGGLGFPICSLSRGGCSRIAVEI